jgi:hypothetical protein
VTIDWSKTITLNPKFGSDPDGGGKGGKGGILIPAYGKYGGPQISGLGDPVDATPVDELDTLFMLHDVAIEEAMKYGLKPAELVIPHAALINGIVGSEKGNIPGLKETDDGLLVVDDIIETPLTGDAEATIYGGMTVFALTAELAQHGLLGQLEAALDPLDPVKFDDVPRVLQDAQRYMERGLEEAPSAGKGLNGALQLFENEFVQLLGTPDTPLSSGASDYFF